MAFDYVVPGKEELKSLTTRASKLAKELSYYYEEMKTYYNQERDLNLSDRLLKWTDLLREVRLQHRIYRPG